MNRFLFISLISLLVLSGCTKRADSVGEDLDRLQRIDRKMNDGDFDYALEETTKYVQEYPRSYKGWGLLGWAYLKTDEIDKAGECFDKSLGFNPKWDNALVGKGAMYRKAGDNENARKSYLEAIRILPENAEAYSSLLVIELLEGNDEKAVEFGEKAWALRKDMPGIPANLSIAYHYLGDHAKRDQFYQHAERLKYHRLETIQAIIDGEIDLR